MSTADATSLAMILFCYPLSNATVECLFSVTSSVKSKLRNLLAVAMVESILGTRYGMKRRGENCSNFAILPGMLTCFNAHHRLPRVAQPLGANPNLNPEENDDAEFVEVLNDVEELFGEPVFFTE